MAKRKSKSILSGTFDFDPEEYLNKLLEFDLKKTSEEKIIGAIIEKLLNNDTYLIEHRDGTNVFCIRKDEKQVELDQIIKIIKAIGSNINKSANKSRVSQLKQMKKGLLNGYSSLGETFVDIDDDGKTESLDKLMDRKCEEKWRN